MLYYSNEGSNMEPFAETITNDQIAKLAIESDQVFATSAVLASCTGHGLCGGSSRSKGNWKLFHGPAGGSWCLMDRQYPPWIQWVPGCCTGLPVRWSNVGEMSK